ncbi:MAG: UDP-glucose--hexose-1-phosphate uridylyltransferase [Oscillospiraceae bacterium]|nr:UDP-glucose--hexose-1-phosphate uridylyltransferase [Oscillospiraceae bacterium]
MIDSYIKALISNAVAHGLIEETDRVYCTNSILYLLKKDSVDFSCPEAKGELHELLDKICDYAAENGLIEDSITYRDLFDTALMGALTPRPSQVIEKFNSLYAESPEKATDYYYALSGNTNYIRRDRIAKILKWQYDSNYGTIDITVNLSKPEKDPKAIAAAKNAPQSGYPKCQLCRECEGYAGRVDFPARQNHRIIPITINNSNWFMQYSPYVYYNEHCIVFNGSHTPMKIDKSAFSKLLEFVGLFPHYFIGSNADLPIVGGSILSHEHFQGGRYEFAMERAPIEKEIEFKGFNDIKAGIVKWPMSTIRLQSESPERLAELADKILTAWRSYTDESAFIFAETDGTPHNTITPIARRRGGAYELDLVLRNNITTEEHPLGVYHPHAELHHIKKENIGLIEVMGLAVLPPRLKTELEALADAIVGGKDLRASEGTAKHADWAEKFIPEYSEINSENVMDILKAEVGKVFATVLEHAGVFKRDSEGMKAFERFINSVETR